MAPPAVTLNNYTFIAQCRPLTGDDIMGEEVSSPDDCVGQLRASDPKAVEVALDEILQAGNCSAKLIQPLLELLSSNDPIILGKTLTALMFMRENGVPFTPGQEKIFAEKLGSAQIELKDGVLKIAGKGLKLSNGVVLDEGTISFKDGKWYVAKGEKAVISGVKISDRVPMGEREEDVLLFFDGKEHPNSGAYLSLNVLGKQLIIGGAKAGQLVASFVANNPFVTIEKHDDVEIELYGQAVVTVVDRTSQDLIPKLMVKGENGTAIIRNGWIEANITHRGEVAIELIGESGKRYQKEWERRPLTYWSSGTPLDVMVLDAQNQSVLPLKVKDGYSLVKKGYRLILNNYGQAGFLNGDQQTSVGSASSEFPPFKITASLSENIQEYYPGGILGKFGIPVTNHNWGFVNDSSNIKNAIDYLNVLSPQARKSIKAMGFPSEDWFAEKVKKDSDIVGAYALYSERSVNLKKPGLSLPAFCHEVAHLLIFDLRDSGSDFEKKWTEAAGEVYGEKHVRYPDKGFPAYTWKESGTDGEPKYGCVRAYGCKEFGEDVATFVEQVVKDPRFFAPLLDHKSKQYDPRYEQKLILLRDYGFITEEQFKSVFSS
ncbi:MAG: hypothetical protein NT099_06645 [Candidatus Saganbacteria bacterium]|nr:hypothetical protein [Candidatus Saganbacteria bacterium]